MKATERRELAATEVGRLGGGRDECDLLAIPVKMLKRWMDTGSRGQEKGLDWRWTFGSSG